MAINVALDPNNTPAQNKNELLSALGSYTSRGGEIILPRAEVPFPIDPGITWPQRRNIELHGEGGALGYDIGQSGTTLKFTSGGVGFDFSQQDWNDPAVPYAVMSGIAIDGDNVCSTLVRAAGIMTIEDCNFYRAGTTGVLANKLLNCFKMGGVSVVGCGQYGVVIGDADGGATPNNTVVLMDDVRVRSNGNDTSYNGVGVLVLQAQGLRWNGGIVEANYGYGLRVLKTANRVVENLGFRDIWFEANWRGQNGYAIQFDGVDAAPRDVFMEDCHISVGGLSKAIDASRLENSRFSHLLGSGAIRLSSATSNVGLLDMAPGFTVTDLGTANWQKSLSQIGTGSGGSGGSGTWPITVEYTLPDQNQTLTAAQVVNGLLETFFTANRNVTMPAATDIITAMGGYVQGATAEFVIMNRTSGTANVILLGGAGTTIKGNNQIALGSGLFAVRIDSPTTVSIINKSRN